MPRKATLDTLENRRLIYDLGKQGFNQRHIAARLGMSQPRLSQIIAKHRIFTFRGEYGEGLLLGRLRARHGVPYLKIEYIQGRGAKRTIVNPTSEQLHALARIVEDIERLEAQALAQPTQPEA